MSPSPVSVGGRAEVAELKNELLGRLGLRADASDQDIEAAHNGLVQFLELAPHEVKSWAAAMTTEVDEAFALLSGPEQEMVRATRSTATQDELAGTPQPPAVTPFAPGPGTPGKPRQPRWVWVIVGLVLAVAVAFGVFQMGKGSGVPGSSGKPTGQETTAAASGANKATPVDQAQVGALTKKISANPKDTASLLALGDLYFAATDYKTAAVWEQKVLDLDPKNQVALLALGAAQFNQRNAAEAKKHWLLAAKLYPNLAEVHYDLGFLYMSQSPPDTARMTAEWKQVIAIDPTSDFAKTVSSHIKAPSPAASPAPTAK